MMNRAGLDMVDADSLEQVKGLCVYPLVTEQYRDAFKEMVEAVFRGENRTLEYSAVGLKGRLIWLYSHAVPLRNEKGEITSLLSATVDITERKQAEEELRERKHQLSESQRVAKIGSWSWDIDNNRLDWSDETFRRFDKDPETFIPTGEYFISRIHPDDRERIQNDIQNSIENDAPYHIQPRIINESGREWVLEGFGFVERDDIGRPVRFAGTAQDITERREAENRIKESEERFRSIFEQTSEGIMIADYEKKEQIEANRAICNMLGYTREELLNLYVDDLHPRESLPRVFEAFEKQVRGEESLATNLPMLRKDGTVIYVDVNATPIKLNGRNCLVGFFRNITERKEAEEKLREREHQLSESQRIAHIGSWQHNLTTNEVIWSYELFRLLGLDPEKDPGDFDMFFSMIHPDDQPILKKGIENTLKTGEHFSVEYRFRLRDGRTRILYAQAELITDSTGTQNILSGTGQDITERREAEDRIKETLKEKEILLKEIHHRVKNNMAIISSLLQLQARYSNDEKVIQLLKDSQNRISSMALVHEKLYQTKDFTNINFREYIKELVGHLMSTHGKKGEDIDLVMDIDDISFNIDTLIPCGLIINELVTNSLKHAFENVEIPEIRISFDVEDCHGVLVYSDNGSGMPQHIDIQNSKTLGLQIIIMLAMQLKGTVELDRSNGTRFIINMNITS